MDKQKPNKQKNGNFIRFFFHKTHKILKNKKKTLYLHLNNRYTLKNKGRNKHLRVRHQIKHNVKKINL